LDSVTRILFGQSCLAIRRLFENCFAFAIHVVFMISPHIVSLTTAYILIYLDVKAEVGKTNCFSYNRFTMRKDTPLAFRIPSDLKEKLKEVSRREARSISQICEILLRLGIEGYEREGSKYLQRLLSRQKKTPDE